MAAHRHFSLARYQATPHFWLVEVALGFVILIPSKDLSLFPK
ncbi:hypothetical protein FH063_002302 [Azospirillum argentinense]|uniref:Uncharacterized protein n=1 Tax=Azospirillum argentinense TaxID=2970906 RepID=A0A5B0KQ49_9PROT|nr:hypothetical protein FH063_002302 [Azospirillum argentinense]